MTAFAVKEGAPVSKQKGERQASNKSHSKKSKTSKGGRAKSTKDKSTKDKSTKDKRDKKSANKPKRRGGPRRSGADKPRPKKPKGKKQDHGLLTGPQRIQKLLARAGFGSRRTCEEFILEGRVSVDGVVVTELGSKADPAVQDVRVDGNRLKRETSVYYLVNKPKGVVCTSKDPQHRQTVVDLVPNERRRIFSVGRLDYESRGAVILTNDGRLTNLLTHPRYGVEKTYQVRVRGVPDGESIARLRSGIWLSEGMTLPARVWIVHKRRAESIVGITLCEGKNRQVRRMFAKVGHKVLGLTRTGIGPITLKGLGDGGVRELKRWEIDELLEDAQSNAQAPRTRPRGRGSRNKSLGKPDPALRGGGIAGAPPRPAQDD